MAANDILVKIGADITDFSRKMAESNKALSNFSKANSDTFGAFKKTGDMLTKGITVPAAAAVTALTGVTLVKGFGRLLGIDTARAKLTALGHDGESVEMIMDNALESVKGTSYGMDEAATTAANAVAAGVTIGKELSDYLSLTGDAAAIAGTSMSEMGSIINKVTTAGKAYNGELQMLSDRGLPIYQWLADEANTTADAIFDMASNGEVSTEMFLKAIENNIGGAAKVMGEESFGAALKNIGSDIARIGANFLDAGGDGEGFFSTLKPLLTEFRGYLETLEGKAAELGTKLGEAFSKAIDTIRDLKARYDELSPAMQDVVKKATAFGAIFLVALGPVLKFIGFIPQLVSGFMSVLTVVKAVGKALMFFTTPIGIIIAAVALVAFLVYKYWDEIKAFTISTWESISDFFTNLWQGIKESAVNVWEGLKTFLNDLWTSIKEGAKSLWDGVTDAWDSAVTGVTGAWESVKQFFADLWVAISEPAIKAWDTVVEKVEKAILYIQGIVSPIAKFFEDTWETVAEAVTSVWDNVVKHLSTVWGNIKSTAKSAWTIIKNAVLGPVLLLINLVTGNFEELKDNAKAIWNNISKEAITIWENIVESLTSFFNTLWENIKIVFSAIGETITGAWEAIKETFINSWTEISEFLIEKLNYLDELFIIVMNNILQTIADVWNWIYEAWETILSTIMDSTSENFQTILESIQKIMEDIWIAIENVWNYIKESFLNATAFIKALLSGDFEVMKDMIGEQMTLAKDTLESIWESIKSIFKNTLEIIKATVSESWNNIKSTISSVSNSIKSTVNTIWNGIKTFFTETLRNIWNNVKQKFDDIKESIRTKMTEAKETIENIWDGVMGFFEGIDLKQIGKDIIDGLIGGIKSKIEDVKDAVKSVTDSITGKIKSILGIASPSRVLAQIGRWTGEGLANGITDTAGLVERASDMLGEAAIPDQRVIDMTYATPSGLSSTLASAVSGTVDVNTREDVIAGAIEHLGNKLENLRIEMDRREFGRVVSDEVTSQRDASVRGGGRRRI